MRSIGRYGLARLRALALILAVLPLSGQAQAPWPSRPITVVVPYAAGSLPDVFMRLVATELGTRLNSTVIVDNVNGAGGVIGTTRAAQAKPDGHTLVLGVESTMLIAQMVRPATVRYNGLKDFTPVALMASAPLVLVGRPGLPTQSLEALLVQLRAQPRSLSYGTSGIGTSLHLAGEMFNQQTQAEITHVPYAVSTQIMTDVAGDQLDLAMVPLGSALPFVRSGKVRALGITSERRNSLLPMVPAMSEQPALKHMQMTVWFGLFAPAGLPSTIAARLHGQILEIMHSDAVKQRLTDFGLQEQVLDPAGLARFMVNEQARFRKLVDERHIQAD